jgi:N-acetylmuramoyl-L-alanine amidase
MKTSAVVFAVVLFFSTSTPRADAQDPLLQKAHEAFLRAETLGKELDEKPAAERTRADYLKAINAYQRVYVITPRTSYADDALMSIAHLYEEMGDPADAIKTLNFLVREYPGTPFKDAADKDIVRLGGDASPTPKTNSIDNTSSIDNVRYWEEQNSVRVAVDVSGEVNVVKGEAKSPDRVFVDISPAHLNSVLAGKQWSVASSLVSQIRVGQYNATTVRVVLHVGGKVQVSTASLREPDRLIIDVSGEPQRVAPAAPLPPPSVSAPAPAPAPISTTRPVNSNPEPPRRPAEHVPPVATAELIPPPDAKNADTNNRVITPASPPNSGPRSLIRSLGLKLSRVVIDAGHGGHDTGSIGPGGYTEKELVLDVAMRLKEKLERELAAEVVMTRTDDSFVPLEKRTAIANEQESDLFISIHANSSRVRSVRGVETFYLNFTSSREALETASRENAASERSIHELQDLVNRIMLRDKVDESRELAEHVQNALAARKGAGANRGVKQAPFVVLIGANMPSVLAEISFISNPQEERLIKTAQTRQAIAEALFDGVRSYAESLSGTKTAKTQEKPQE